MIETQLVLTLKIRDIYIYNTDEITGQTLISHQRKLRKKGKKKNIRKFILKNLKIMQQDNDS